MRKIQAVKVAPVGLLGLSWTFVKVDLCLDLGQRDPDKVLGDGTEASGLALL